MDHSGRSTGNGGSLPGGQQGTFSLQQMPSPLSQRMMVQGSPGGGGGASQLGAAAFPPSSSQQQQRMFQLPGQIPAKMTALQQPQPLQRQGSISSSQQILPSQRTQIKPQLPQQQQRSLAAAAAAGTSINPPAPSPLPPPPSSPVGAKPTLLPPAPGGGLSSWDKVAATKTDKPKQPPASNKRAPAAVKPPEMPAERMIQLVHQCNWIDRSLWASRMLMGGQSVNAFLSATATVQRVKKQRARQNAKSKDKEEAESKKRPADETEQEAEETLKKEIMNVRTAKKLKAEFEVGIQYCAMLHEAVRSIVYDMGVPGLPPIEPLGAASRGTHVVPRPLPKPVSRKTSLALAKPPATKRTSSSSSQSVAVGASTRETTGSTLRRNRKIKLPPSGEPPLKLSEFEEGKRIKKKDQHLRLFEVLRFRELRPGDAVAARVSSRDLWILARVVDAYPGHNMKPADFLRLSVPRRDQLFKDTVKVKDVEDVGNISQVARNLVLPLPRSCSEAAEWCQRVKRGARVYAMYPQTTSLYSGTVVDSTTWARGDDDIVVVEFDGDEPDATGVIPGRHIPARFVTLIPKEFQATKAQTVAATGAKAKKRGSASSSSAAAATPAPSDDPLSGVLDDMTFRALPSLDGFDDLDFDLLGGT